MRILRVLYWKMISYPWGTPFTQERWSTSMRLSKCWQEWQQKKTHWTILASCTSKTSRQATSSTRNVHFPYKNSRNSETHKTRFLNSPHGQIPKHKHLITLQPPLPIPTYHYQITPNEVTPYEPKHILHETAIYA